MDSDADTDSDSDSKPDFYVGLYGTVTIPQTFDPYSVFLHRIGIRVKVCTLTERGNVLKPLDSPNLEHGH